MSRSVGFFIDAYDLFIINLVTINIQWEYYGGENGSDNYPPLLHGAVNAAANIGNVFGQLLFGLLGDTFGRKFVYGKEMIVAIVGIILTISLPNSLEPTAAKFWWLFAWRVVMGIGIGGDYPMSAAIVAERSTLQNRGRMIGFIFSNQGWGNLAGSIVTLILYAAFKDALTNGEYGQLDAIWRLQIGLVLVPCIAVLYFRLTMPEGKKYLQSQELTAVQNSSLMASRSTLDSIDAAKLEKDGEAEKGMTDTQRRISVIEAHAAPPPQASKFKVFGQYFGQWRHLKPLIGTAGSWFLVDITFYGLNLNQSIILSDIGFSSGSTPYNTFVRNAYGNLIVAAAGYVPGYFFTIGFIELLGRRWIQIQGFLITALMFWVIPGDWKHNGIGGKFVCFAIAQVRPKFIPLKNRLMLTLLQSSSSSILAPTQRPLSSLPKPSRLASVVLLTASAPQAASSAPSCRPFSSTTSPSCTASRSQTFCGSLAVSTYSAPSGRSCLSQRRLALMPML